MKSIKAEDKEMLNTQVIPEMVVIVRSPRVYCGPLEWWFGKCQWRLEGTGAVLPSLQNLTYEIQLPNMPKLQQPSPQGPGEPHSLGTAAAREPLPEESLG